MTLPSSLWLMLCFSISWSSTSRAPCVFQFTLKTNDRRFISIIYTNSQFCIVAHKIKSVEAIVHNGMRVTRVNLVKNRKHPLVLFVFITEYLIRRWKKQGQAMFGGLVASISLTLRTSQSNVKTTILWFFVG